jgi:hypothetical protein
MITVGVIRNGATYLAQHLRKNDYWADGEKEVQGEWIGAGAQRLGLAGPVTAQPFEALRQNRHPQTGELLTVRNNPNRVAFFDIQLSAPKDVSVLAMVGGEDLNRLLLCYGIERLLFQERLVVRSPLHISWCKDLNPLSAAVILFLRLLVLSIYYLFNK